MIFADILQLHEISEKFQHTTFAGVNVFVFFCEIDMYIDHFETIVFDIQYIEFITFFRLCRLEAQAALETKNQSVLHDITLLLCRIPHVFRTHLQKIPHPFPRKKPKLDVQIPSQKGLTRLRLLGIKFTVRIPIGC